MEKLGILIASGEMPDVFNSEGIEGAREQYSKWIKEGLILSISDYADKYPNLNKTLKQFDLLKIQTGGKHYGLPVKMQYYSNTTAVNEHTMFIRKDWLDNLGLSLPTDVDEFYNVLKKFTYDDPDKNGKDDTYGLTSAKDGIQPMYQVFNLFDASTGRFEKIDEKWVPEVISNEMKEALAFVKKLYDEKILDPEFAANEYEKMLDKFYKGKSGVFPGNSVLYNDFYNSLKQLYPEKDPKSIFTWIPPMKGKNGQKRLDGYGSYWLTTNINAKIGDTKINKALELLDYLSSDEGFNLVSWGIEGIHYKKEGDTFVNLLPKDENGNQKQIGDIDSSYVIRTFTTWATDFFPPTTPNVTDLLKCRQDSMNAAKEDPLNFLYIEDQSFDNTIPQKLLSYVTEEFVNIIMNSKDFNNDWDKFVKSWLEKGGQQYIDAINIQAQKDGR